MKNGSKRKFISETILAKDTTVGEVYVTQGGVTYTKNGKRLSWGFDRVKIVCIEPTFVKVITPWQTEVDLPTNYQMYTTNEKNVKMRFITHLTSRDRTKTKLLTFAEALELGLEQLGDEKPQKKRGTKAARLEPIVIRRLSAPEGVSFSELAAECGERSQFVRYIANQLEKKGYKLINLDGPIYRLEKQ